MFTHKDKKELLEEIDDGKIVIGAVILFKELHPQITFQELADFLGWSKNFLIKEYKATQKRKEKLGSQR